ncbi:hypothetical protein P8610_01615 [Fictibacillus sp. UD]
MERKVRAYHLRNISQGMLRGSSLHKHKLVDAGTRHFLEAGQVRLLIVYSARRLTAHPAESEHLERKSTTFIRQQSTRKLPLILTNMKKREDERK